MSFQVYQEEHVYLATIEEIKETIWCRLGPSKIHGIGVIAIQDIPKGTRIQYEYEKLFWNLPDSYWHLLPKEILHLCFDRNIFERNNNFLLENPNRNAHFRSFMNHSDHPNSDGNIVNRDIKKGEEITESYLQMCKTDFHPTAKKYYKANIFDKKDPEKNLFGNEFLEIQKPQ